MKKQKLVSGILAVAMTFSVLATGCNVSIKGGSGSGTGNGKSDTTLKLGIENKGYGDEWLYKLAEAFEKKTGIDTEVAKSSSAEWIENAVKSGEKNNDVDVFFGIDSNMMKTVATANYVSGYDRAYVDLSDIYAQSLEGYGTEETLEELCYDYGLNYATWGGDEEGYGDGKQYFVTWASGLSGLVYNVDLFQKYKLSVPKTTDEMFALMDKMTTLSGGSYAKNDEGYDIYPYIYSSLVNYNYYPALTWWAQYTGVENFKNEMVGKDANGNYTVSSVASKGKLSMLKLEDKLLNPENGYTNLDAMEMSFTNAQVLFLEKQAFMIPTGDWLEREMASNYSGDADVAFMKIPVNSAVIENCGSVKTDAELSKVIAYIDGETTERPAFVSDEDLKYLQEVRTIYSSNGGMHAAFIPVYSNMIDEGKQFLQFFLSKEGQEIMMEHSNGNMAMLDVDVTQFENYSSLSKFQQSKYDILYGANLVGLFYTHPMNYAGGLTPYDKSMENYFSVDRTGTAYKTPEKVLQSIYQTRESSWSDMLGKAGVK